MFWLLFNSVTQRYDISWILSDETYDVMYTALATTYSA